MTPTERRTHTRSTHSPLTPTKPQQIGRAVIASNLPLDAPKHIFLMLFMLTDRRDPASFFQARAFSLCCVTGPAGAEAPPFLSVETTT